MSRGSRVLLAASLLGATLTGGPAAGEAPIGKGGVESEIPAEGPHRFAATAEVNGCAVDLAHPSSHDPTLRLRVSCPLALDDLLRAFDRLLLTAGPDLPRPATLMLGRIVEYPWLAERLARAASTAPGWDASRGRARQGGSERFVVAILEHRGLLVELVERFAADGLALRVAGAEKVLAGAVGATPALTALATEGFDPEARLPYDAQLWLRIEAQPGAR